MKTRNIILSNLYSRVHKKRDNLGSNIDEWGILWLILMKTTPKLTCSLAELLILLKTLPSQSILMLRFKNKTVILFNFYLNG